MLYFLLLTVLIGNVVVFVFGATTQADDSPATIVNIAATPTPTPTQVQLPCTIRNPPKRPPPPASEEPNPENIRYTAERLDWDCDGISNWDDNCKTIFNPSQIDQNKNKIGDACEAGKPEKRYCTLPIPALGDRKKAHAIVDDPEREMTVDDVRFFAKSADYDCDGISDADDNCPSVYNPKQTDRNRNKIGDACEARRPKPKTRKP